MEHLNGTIDASEKWHERSDTNIFNRHKFPLIPYLKIRKRDYERTWGFSFKWLFFTAWTLDNPYIEISLAADGHWGIGVIGLLPYLRWAATIPCPNAIDSFINRYLGRKPKPKKHHSQYFGKVAVFSVGVIAYKHFTREFSIKNREQISKGIMKMPEFICIQHEKDVRGHKFDSVAFVGDWRENDGTWEAYNWLKAYKPELFKD